MQSEPIVVFGGDRDGGDDRTEPPAGLFEMRSGSPRLTYDLIVFKVFASFSIGMKLKRVFELSNTIFYSATCFAVGVQDTHRDQQRHGLRGHLLDL